MWSTKILAVAAVLFPLIQCAVVDVLLSVVSPGTQRWTPSVPPAPSVLVVWSTAGGAGTVASSLNALWGAMLGGGGMLGAQLPAALFAMVLVAAFVLPLLTLCIVVDALSPVVLMTVVVAVAAAAILA